MAAQQKTKSEHDSQEGKDYMLKEMLEAQKEIESEMAANGDEHEGEAGRTVG